MRRLSLYLGGILIAIVLICGAIGCQTTAVKIIAKKGFHLATGPQGKCFEIKGLAPGAGLGKYNRVEIEKFENELGTLVPTDYPTAISDEFIRKASELRMSKEEEAPRVFTLVTKKTPDKGKGNVLLVRGTIIHYDKGNKMKRNLEQGGEAVMIARVKLVDKATEKQLAVLNVSGVAKEGSTRGVTEGIAKALVKYIVEHRK